MYFLRAGGGNHYTLWASNRSDYSIIRHPEFQLGRIPAERDSFTGWNTCRNKHKPILSHEAKLLRASAKQRAAASRQAKEKQQNFNGKPESKGRQQLTASRSTSLPAAPQVRFAGDGAGGKPAVSTGQPKTAASRPPEPRGAEPQPIPGSIDNEELMPNTELTERMRHIHASGKMKRCWSAATVAGMERPVQSTHSLASVPDRLVEVSRAFRNGSGTQRLVSHDPDFHIKRASKTRPVGYGKFQYMPPESAKPFLEQWSRESTQQSPAEAAEATPGKE